MARLKDFYFKELRDKLKGKFELKNIFEVPKLEKIVVILELVRQLSILKK